MGLRPHYTRTWWFLWYIGHNPIADVLYMILCLGRRPLKHIIDEIFCVEWGALEHMGIWCLCWARSSGAHKCLYLCWARSSRTHELRKHGCVQEVDGPFWHVRCNTKLKKTGIHQLACIFWDTYTMNLVISKKQEM